MAVKNTASGTVVGAAPTPAAAGEKMSDKQASAQLRILHASYVKERKARPKSPSEAKTMPLLFQGEAGVKALTVLDNEYQTATFAWRNKMTALGLAVQAIGKANPGAPIAIEGNKSGRVVQKNGVELFSALLREEADVLNGTAI